MDTHAMIERVLRSRGVSDGFDKLTLILSNIVNKPSDHKYKRIRKSSAAVKKVYAVDGASDLLNALGFKAAEDGTDMLVLAPDADIQPLRETLVALGVAADPVDVGGTGGREEATNSADQQDDDEKVHQATTATSPPRARGVSFSEEEEEKNKEEEPPSPLGLTGLAKHLFERESITQEERDFLKTAAALWAQNAMLYQLVAEKLQAVQYIVGAPTNTDMAALIQQQQTPPPPPREEPRSFLFKRGDSAVGENSATASADGGGGGGGGNADDGQKSPQGTPKQVFSSSGRLGGGSGGDGPTHVERMQEKLDGEKKEMEREARRERALQASIARMGGLASGGTTR